MYRVCLLLLLLLEIRAQSVNIRVYQWHDGSDHFSVSASNNAKARCPDCVWSGCSTVTGVCMATSVTEPWLLTYNQSGEFAFVHKNGTVEERLLVYKVICKNLCFLLLATDNTFCTDFCIATPSSAELHGQKTDRKSCFNSHLFWSLKCSAISGLMRCI